MKKISLSIFMVIFCGMQMAAAQVGEICKWDNYRQAAVVLTFDDWSPGQQPIVPGELKSRNLNATFFIETSLVANWNHDWPTVLTTAADGNEIGNHTTNHPHLLTQNASQLHTEISVARSIIDGHVLNQKATSFAYPFGEGAGSTAKDVEIRDSLKASGHIAARGVSIGNYGYNFAATDDDYFKIMTYTMCSGTTLDNFRGQVTQVKSGGGLLTFLYHSIDNANNTYADTWYCQVKQTALQAQLDHLVTLKDQVWITTFGQAVKYHKERNCAQLTHTGTTSTTMSFTLSDTLSNNDLYSQPLSLKIFRNGINYSTATQNGLPLVIDGVVHDSIIFRAVPDAGEIVLTIGSLGFEPALVDNAGIRVFQGATSSLLTIQTLKPLLNANISILDLSGQEVLVLKNGTVLSAVHLDVSTLSAGMYVVRAICGETVQVQKFALLK
jgi:hypothetical protein